MTIPGLAALTLFAASPTAAQISKFPPDLAAVQATLRDMPAPPVPPAAPIAQLPASIWTDLPIPGLDSPAAREYADEAVRLAAQGFDFSSLFAGLCRHLLDGGPRLGRDPRSETKGLFLGLIRWTRQGGRPSFQGREDRALHFIYGGYITSAYNYALAQSAAYGKEESDAFTPGNFFDLDDYGASLMGARWASLIGKDYEDLRKWVEPWAWGEKKLNALPALRFGTLPHGQLPSPPQIRQVQTFVASSL